MKVIRIEKTVYIRDQYGVKHQVFVAGQTIPQYVYEAKLKLGEVLNPEDLPQVAVGDGGQKSFHSKMEVKVLKEPEDAIEVLNPPVDGTTPEVTTDSTTDSEAEVEPKPKAKSKKG